MADGTKGDRGSKETVYIGLGSNLGDGLNTLKKAWEMIGLADGVELEELSSPYLSAPVGMESKNWFTNGVGRLNTTLGPVEVLDLLLAVEQTFGRRRDPSAAGYQDRTLDLDLLYHGQTVMKTQRLTLPHPCVSDRLFVLEPLTEIGEGYRDPTDGLTPFEKLANLRSRMNEGLTATQEITRSSW